MKTQLKSLLLFLGALLIILGCEKSDSLVSRSAQSSPQLSPQLSDELSDESWAESWAESSSVDSADKIKVFVTTSTLTAIGTPPNVLKTGTFVASPELGDSGIYVMHITLYGAALDSIHCITTFYTRSGAQWTTGSRCSIVTNLGKWRIIYGTRRYANMRGHGSVVMIPDHEMATGRIWTE